MKKLIGILILSLGVSMGAEAKTLQHRTAHSKKAASHGKRTSKKIQKMKQPRVSKSSARKKSDALRAHRNMAKSHHGPKRLHLGDVSRPVEARATDPGAPVVQGR